MVFLDVRNPDSQSVYCMQLKDSIFFFEWGELRDRIRERIEIQLRMFRINGETLGLHQ